MPQFCTASGCSSKRTVQSRLQGITFHRFPYNLEVKKAWEIALKREGFQATKYSVLCSKHFRAEDFDRTGQTIRLRDKVVPSIFNFPENLVKSNKPRYKATSKRATAAFDPVEFAEAYCHSPASESVSYLPEDHFYALPSSPDILKRKLLEAESRVAELERKLRNAIVRERHTKNSLKSVQSELKRKNLVNEELEYKLQLYSVGKNENGMPIESMAKNIKTEVVFIKEEEEVSIKEEPTDSVCDELSKEEEGTACGEGDDIKLEDDPFSEMLDDEDKMLEDEMHFNNDSEQLDIQQCPAPSLGEYDPLAI